MAAVLSPVEMLPPDAELGHKHMYWFADVYDQNVWGAMHSIFWQKDLTAEDWQLHYQSLVPLSIENMELVLSFLHQEEASPQGSRQLPSHPTDTASQQQFNVALTTLQTHFRWNRQVWVQYMTPRPGQHLNGVDSDMRGHQWMLEFNKNLDLMKRDLQYPVVTKSPIITAAAALTGYLPNRALLLNFIMNLWNSESVPVEVLE
ncbi:hypothetical protein BS47DRAFT_1362083 [Hydnum rufescens UP504]|uniref:Uncharacterized protein n=1 Tax=Hydnum rufescens UP504 TaxID=1448309 RepID=A0A9P6B097_9AGAM|nr:hypothetical protein BS47DRAFT_1362083 [Hydnum rufescens UP504]